MTTDPVVSNPALYTVVFEYERVRVLEYHDRPGDRSVPHDHPDSVMITLSSFRRRLATNDRSIEVELPSNAARWLDAQHHSGENIGDSDTHCIFVELKEQAPASTERAAPLLGPRDH